MILVRNDKPLRLVGYIESSATEGVLLTVQRLEFTDIEVIRPDEFKKLENKNDYQYFVTIVLDQDERKEIIDIIDNLNLDCISFVDDTCLIHESAKIGKGVIIFGFSLIMAHAVIGNHVMIDAYCLVAHHSEVGDNCHLNPGTMIAGRTTVGKNCTFGMKSGVINKVNICDNTHVGAFSNVTKNIEIPGIYIGSPARLRGTI
jgi:sugar O-acyltransferase (sialic acid O-acetyltransferase NeuD family)